jgi:hypothetical protein
MTLAPICLFTYNRLEETKRTVEALQKNNLALESELYIFSDGSKSDKGKKEIQILRNYLKTVDGFKNVTVFESSENKGLAKSIVLGVSSIIKKYGKVIVLEDDLISSTNFLDYMNQALVFYEKNEKVFSISGYTLSLPSLSNYSKDFYLGYRASSWGWGTWLNRWEIIDWGVKDYQKFKWNLISNIKFMRGGSDLPLMLYRQMNGKIDSWAIRWCFHQFKNDLLTVNPTKSKIMSIGFGETATHTKTNDRFETDLDYTNKQTFNFEDSLNIDKMLVKEFRDKFSFIKRIKTKLKI